jgi:hypothetical protein
MATRKMPGQPQGLPGQKGLALSPSLSLQQERELENEYRRLTSAQNRLRKRAQAFKDSEPKIAPYRYVLNYEFDVSGVVSSDEPVNIALFPEQTRSFTVKQGSVFFCKALGMAFEPQGVLRANGQNARVSLGSGAWKEMFNFDWRVRDTGAFNREWQNRALPGSLLMSNAIRPLMFGNGHAQIEAGTEVLFTVIPQRIYILTGGTSMFSALTKLHLEISFSGEERILPT